MINRQSTYATRQKLDRYGIKVNLYWLPYNLMPQAFYGCYVFVACIKCLKRIQGERSSWHIGQNHKREISGMVLPQAENV